MRRRVTRRVQEHVGIKGVMEGAGKPNRATEKARESQQPRRPFKVRVKT